MSESQADFYHKFLLGHGWVVGSVTEGVQNYSDPLGSYGAGLTLISATKVQIERNDMERKIQEFREWSANDVW